MSTQRFSISPYLLLTLTCLFWAGNSVVGRALRDDVPPITLSFWRWCIALAILLPWIVRPLARQWRAILLRWKVMVFLSLLGIPTYNTINYAALHTTTATNSALINSACTVMIIAVNYLLFRVRGTLRQWVGLAVSLTGVLVIVSRGEPQALLALALVRGDILLLIAALFWAVYTACLRWRPRELDQLTFAGTSILIGVIALAPLYWWEASHTPPIVFTPGVVAAVLYTGIFPSVLATLFWNKAVADVGANRSGQFMNLVPVFGIALAVIFLDEALEVFHLVGAAVIFAGIYLATARVGHADRRVSDGTTDAGPQTRD
ncbi:MAG TPA: DMT family transporter [Burkholderiales bacterium]|nr:DMT family transporter [Burkholderiales bacterium]